MTSLLDIFLSECYTHEELARKIRVSKQVLECVYYKQDVTSEDHMKRLPQCLDLAVLTAQDAEFIQKILESKYITEESLYAQLSDVIKQSEQLPTITITIVMPIDSNQQKAIGMWLRKNVDNRVMFRTITDPSCIGGCGLSYNGEYKDYTIRNAFDQKRNLVREIISKQLATPKVG